jgi:signal transduction histidine kinase
VTISAGAVLSALLWSAVAGVATWFLLLPARRRWLAGLFVSVALTATAASIGALLGGIHSMLLPTQDWTTVVTLTIGAGAVAAVAATAAARRISSDNRVLRLAVAELAEGRVPDPSGRPLTAELEGVRRELAATATALAETRDRERALELSRRELVSWVSHDLRTPLAGLRAMTEALEDGVVDDAAPYYKQMAASVDRLSGLVDDLFNLSRIQAGEARQVSDEVSLDDLASDVLAALGPLAATRGIRLTGRPSGGATVRGDAQQLDRAITNLVANAIRHTPDDGAVEVEVLRDGSAVEVAVRDQCGGIAAADLPRLFDVGFRGESARTARTGDGTAGAGLGLAIARGIVEAHHGTIDVANTADGCRFVVTLPAA